MDLKMTNEQEALFFLYAYLPNLDRSVNNIVFMYNFS